MKVIGSGDPLALQVRLAHSERAVFAEAVSGRVATLLRQFGDTETEAAGEIEPQEELAALQRLADQLNGAEDRGQALIQGPTAVVGRLVDSASRAASRELVDAVEAACEGDADALIRLGAAIGPAQATASTLVSYRRILDPALSAVVRAS